MLVNVALSNLTAHVCNVNKTTTKMTQQDPTDKPKIRKYRFKSSNQLMSSFMFNISFINVFYAIIKCIKMGYL